MGINVICTRVYGKVSGGLGVDSIKNFDVISEYELSMVEGGGLGKAIIGGAVAGAWGGLVTGGPAGAFVGAHVGAAGGAIGWTFNH